MAATTTALPAFSCHSGIMADRCSVPDSSTAAVGGDSVFQSASHLTPHGNPAAVRDHQAHHELREIHDAIMP